MDLVKKLRESGNKLLQSEAEDIANWSKLRHAKSDLELFLNFNIAEIKFKTKDNDEVTSVFTSNTTLIKLFSTKKETDKKKVAKLKSNGMKTPDMGSVLSWDLLDDKPKTILLKNWTIMNFISITPANILVLDMLINDLLKK